MHHCVLMGDSIAVGMASVLHAAGWACLSVARVGASSADLPRQLLAAGRPRIAVISVGSNDPPGKALAGTLDRARRALGARQVVWVLPYRRTTAYAVTQVALRFDDAVLDVAGFPSRDHVHPADYRRLAAALTR